MSSSTSRARALLFDLDGTLLDTAPDMAAALNELRREASLNPLSFQNVRPLVSHGATALVRLAFPGADMPALNALRERFLEIYSGRLAVETRPYPGMLEILSRLEASEIPWGIVTNKPGWLTVPLLEQLSLRHRAHVIVSGDTLAKRKPDPEPLLYAAAQLGVTSGDCVYVGDDERDVLAGRAAGMRVFVALFGYILPGERPREWPASGWVESPEAIGHLLDSLFPP
jgi:2-phosphoglycolate phosphatase